MTYEFMTGINAAWNMLMSGNFLGSVLLIYTNVWGYSFYMIICFAAMMVIYLRTDNIGTMLVTGMVISGVALAYMPAMIVSIIIGFMGLCMACLLYKAFH